MLDYKGLEAIAAVIETQSFAQAANQLFITQSAVTQRIKHIESHFGQPLLIRSHPYQATTLGEKLLSLFRRIQLQEQHVLHEITQQTATPRVSIALNRDSLETWYMQAIATLPLFKKIQSNIITDDQEVTIDFFKQGLVNACLSTRATPLTGCECAYLGNMEYVLAASPQFIAQHFTKKSVRELSQAPLLAFDKKDKLHHHFFAENLGIADVPLNIQYMPSVRGFKLSTLQGLGYGLLPKIDIVSELKTGELIDLFPDKHCPMPLYWHYWQIQTDYYKQFNQAIIDFAQQTFNS